MPLLTVDCKNLYKNPACPHGPTLRYSRVTRGNTTSFFVCSAYRDRKACPFYLRDGESLSESKKLSIEHWKASNIPVIDHMELVERLRVLYKTPPHQRKYCLTCQSFILDGETCHTSHKLFTGVIWDQCLAHPSMILQSISNNKGEAQYFFKGKTVNVLVNNITATRCEGVVCIGTPTIFEAIKGLRPLSILLDIDYRYHNFYSPYEFCWFNMFNFHFFGDLEMSTKYLRRVLKAKSLAIIIDPPFGARYEPLRESINKLKAWHEEENENNSTEISVFLISPVYMKNEILNVFPELYPMDFQVEYINHSKFKTRSSGRNSSPVIFFTNFMKNFPYDRGYKFCVKCQLWVSEANNHCDKCEKCTSICGIKHFHCIECRKCVKKSWFHCKPCGLCVNNSHICWNSIGVAVH